MRRHKLKTWPSQFAAILDGSKTFEFRRNDRDFAVGDLLELREWDPASMSGVSVLSGAYTGRLVLVKVTYMLEGRFGMPDGYCVMAISREAAAIDAPEPPSEKRSIADNYRAGGHHG